MSTSQNKEVSSKPTIVVSVDTSRIGRLDEIDGYYDEEPLAMMTIGKLND